MTFHCGKRAANDVAADSNEKKFAVRLNQRGNSPECNHHERQQNSTGKFKASDHLPVSHVNDYDSDGEQRCPCDWTFGEKAEREREIEPKERRFPKRTRRARDRRSWETRGTGPASDGWDHAASQLPAAPPKKGRGAQSASVAG